MCSMHYLVHLSTYFFFKTITVSAAFYQYVQIMGVVLKAGMERNGTN